eukprot:GHVR01034605.1.p2 GENE.GHVR01034605.1~~GHVR01034605.1.p2  ORF type:complete len:101 (-),score=4.65 GHVR01034605.1:1211-1513(-)
MFIFVDHCQIIFNLNPASLIICYSFQCHGLIQIAVVTPDQGLPEKLILDLVAVVKENANPKIINIKGFIQIMLNIKEHKKLALKFIKEFLILKIISNFKS